jgi:hypothetical protein
LQSKALLHAVCASLRLGYPIQLVVCAVPEQFGIYAFGIGIAVYVQIGIAPLNPSVLTTSSFIYDAAKITVRATMTITKRV